MTAIADTTDLAIKLEAYLLAQRARRHAVRVHGTNLIRDRKNMTHATLDAVNKSRLRLERAYRELDLAKAAYVAAGGSVR